MVAEPLAAPVCRRHPAEPASGTCARCGSYACTVCAREELGQLLCPDCFARPAIRLTASPRARRALWVALAGLHGLVFLLPVALWLATVERDRIRRGTAPRAGEPWVQGATAVSLGGVLIWFVIAMLLGRRYGADF